MAESRPVIPFCTGERNFLLERYPSSFPYGTYFEQSDNPLVFGYSKLTSNATPGRNE